MLYRWNIIGHEKELTALENDIYQNNIHHAYLFVGPEKIGKSRVAKTFLSILQCQNNFCHTCPACAQIEKKCHPDTIELCDDGESVKINAVRDIIARLNMTCQSPYKILLIENMGRLTDEAVSCLLKTLEEPPEKTIFIFTANQLQDIMPTIASRMRIINFRKLPDVVLRTALKERYPEIDEETLDQVMALSLGRSGRAIKLLSEPETFEELRQFYRHIQFLDTKASTGSRLVSMTDIAADPQKMKLFLSLLGYHFRKALTAGGGPEKTRRALNVLQELHKVMNLMSYNVNPRLSLEHIMLQL